MPSINIFWFRRDLRFEDNHGFFEALKAGLPVLPLFIFDQEILEQLEDRDDRRVGFIHDTVSKMNATLHQAGATMDIRYGLPAAVFAGLCSDYQVEAVFTNHDYEPYATARDRAIAEMLQEQGVAFHSFKDQVIFEKSEVVKNDGLPYGVYTPFSKRWKMQLKPHHYEAFGSAGLLDKVLKQSPKPVPSLESMGFSRHPDVPNFGGVQESIIQHYHSTRDFPAVEGTTRLGLHLRFGTVSVRSLVQKALQLNETFLGELIWREFFMQLLWHQPRLAGACSRPEYEAIRWRNNEQEFEQWCAGQTGYPIVDAGMRQLNATGFMHNRVRMVAASFMVKHLLIDWRWGEGYFARRLLDFDLSANNGNWQWVAGCGCDAAPYFRIFNPAAQAKRFDQQEAYIRKWVPEYKTKDYALPMVDHEKARQRCLAVYKEALQQKYAAQAANKLFPD